jgi:hypothetical protein
MVQVQAQGSSAEKGQLLRVAKEGTQSRTGQDTGRLMVWHAKRLAGADRPSCACLVPAHIHEPLCLTYKVAQSRTGQDTGRLMVWHAKRLAGADRPSCACLVPAHIHKPLCLTYKVAPAAAAHLAGRAALLRVARPLLHALPHPS